MTTRREAAHAPLRLSVVIPCYQYEDFVGAAIESVLHGTRPADEVIVVDDGSTDRSAEVAAAFPGVTLIRQENGGMASAVNRGVAESTGDVVVLLDADDLAAPGRLAWVEEAFADPDVVMAWHPLRIRDEAGERGLCPDVPLPDGDVLAQVAATAKPIFPITSGVAVRRRALDAVGAVPETDFRNFAESFLVRSVPAVGRVAATQEPLGVYRMHSRSDMRRAASTDPAQMAAKLRVRIQMADTEQALLVRVVNAAGHALDVGQLRAHDWVYQDLSIAEARLSTASRRDAWRAIRSIDLGSQGWTRSLAVLARGVVYTLLPVELAAWHQLVRAGEPSLQGTARIWSRVYWRTRLAVERVRGHLRLR